MGADRAKSKPHPKKGDDLGGGIPQQGNFNYNIHKKNAGNRDKVVHIFSGVYFSHGGAFFSRTLSRSQHTVCWQLFCVQF